MWTFVVNYVRPSDHRAILCDAYSLLLGRNTYFTALIMFQFCRKFCDFILKSAFPDCELAR